MESQFGLHLKHSAKWIRAAQVAPDLCPGKDPEDTKCTCSDTMYSTRVRVFTGETIESRFYCGCCGYPIFHDHPAPSGAGARPTLVDREA